MLRSEKRHWDCRAWRSTNTSEWALGKGIIDTILQESSEGEGNTRRKVLPFHKVVEVNRIQATIVKYAESKVLSLTSKGDAARWSTQRSKGKHGPY